MAKILVSLLTTSALLSAQDVIDEAVALDNPDFAAAKAEAEGMAVEALRKAEAGRARFQAGLRTLMQGVPTGPREQSGAKARRARQAAKIAAKQAT